MLKITLNFKKLNYTIGLFFLIFAFPLLPGLSSAKLMLFIVALIYLMRNDFKKQIFVATQTLGRPFLVLFLMVLLINLAMPILWLSFDWSLVTSTFSAITFYFVTFLFLEETKKHINVKKAVYYCFIVQSLFILCAILSQSFYDVTAHFRDVSQHHQEAYGRLRGNAISGYQFFGIVIIYTFAIIYFFLNPKGLPKKGIFMTLILSMAICSGRSCILAIGIGVLFYLIQIWKYGQYKKIIITLGITTGIIVVASSLLINNYQKINDPMMYLVVERYLVEPLESLGNNSGFETSSTDRLEEMYDEDEIKKHFSLGSGRYTNDDGTYFGHVDIGYYRLLGYSGYLGLLLDILCTWALIFRSKSSLGYLTKVAFFLNILLYNFKGGVYVWDNNIVPLLVIFLFFCDDYSQKKNNYTILQKSN